MDASIVSKPNAVIFDMDGTLADVSSIRHYLKRYDNGKDYKDFHAFHAESVNVPTHPHVVDHALRAHLLGNAVLIVTARRAMWRHHTAWFLAMHGIPSDALYMRGNNDNRPDYHVKKDILASIRTRYNVIHAVDDNPSVIALWHEEGISTTVVEGWEA